MAFYPLYPSLLNLIFHFKANTQSNQHFQFYKECEVECFYLNLSCLSQPHNQLIVLMILHILFRKQYVKEFCFYDFWRLSKVLHNFYTFLKLSQALKNDSSERDNVK